MNQFISQLPDIATLYAEVLLCIAAAGVLGWIVGFMMQRSRYKRKLAKTSAMWQTRYEALDYSSRSDALTLEEQIQSLAQDHKSLQANNRALAESMKKNDTNVQQGLAEYIELNRQNTETHERLQRIIEQKDREIAELGNRLGPEFKSAGKTLVEASAKAPASITRLPLDSLETDLDSADTIALTSIQSIDTAKISLAQPSTEIKQQLLNKKAAIPTAPDLDESLDDTSDLSEYGIEESTVAMDEDALAFVQQSFKGRRRD